MNNGISQALSPSNTFLLGYKTNEKDFSRWYFQILFHVDFQIPAHSLIVIHFFDNNENFQSKEKFSYLRRRRRRLRWVKNDEGQHLQSLSAKHNISQ